MSTAANSQSIAAPFGAMLPLAPAALSTPPGVPPRSPSVLRQIATVEPYRLSVAQFEQMIQSGVLTKYDRCELVRGELIEKMTLGDHHMAAMNRLVRLFKRVRDDEALMSVQQAVKLRDSRPEPDLKLLVPREDCYETQTAGPPDVLLLIEVADSSLSYDREVKLPLYAENGIREYWIVNLIDGCIEVYRQPQGSDYAERLMIRRGESVSPLALPALTVAAADILGLAVTAETAG